MRTVDFQDHKDSEVLPLLSWFGIRSDNFILN